jgi:hypothetical protein
MKFGMKIRHKYSHKLCVKYYLQVRSYKYDDGAKLCGFV